MSELQTMEAPVYGSPYGGPYNAEMAQRQMLGVQDVREQFRDVIDAAENDGKHTVVLRRSKPVAVIVPTLWYHDASEKTGEPWDDYTPPRAGPRGRLPRRKSDDA